MRELVEAFFRERSIVNHHIASYNDFLPTPDNLNSGMQRLVDNIRIGESENGRGIIRLEVDKTSGETIEIRVGRLRNPKTGAIERNAKPTVFVDMPKVKEANGATHPLTPMEARLRNLNYEAPIYLECTVVENGVDKEPERVHIGNLPVMVKSKKCNIHRDNIDSEVELSDKEYLKHLIEFGEDPLDAGGYFIIGGTERALISLEDLAPNRVMVEFKAIGWRWQRSSLKEKATVP
jgi:DNA-directed RNA polymerase subunit B